MAKDPAFLFYSTDFYEGTRTMLPEERTCYVDLMIYQHQRGPIPNDLQRVLLYCNGISEATLKATLQAKFKLTDKGWLSDNNHIKPIRTKSIFHHNWKGGIYETVAKIRCCPAYKKWKVSVLKRDNYTCRQCGNKKSLHVHHIKSFSRYPDLRFDINNGITLCVKCHKLTHKNKNHGA